MAIVHIDDAVAATVAALTAEPGGNNVERIDIMSQPVNDDAIDFFEIDQDITLRRMVLRNSNPKGTRSLPAWVSGDLVRLEGHRQGSGR